MTPLKANLLILYHSVLESFQFWIFPLFIKSKQKRKQKQKQTVSWNPQFSWDWRWRKLETDSNFEILSKKSHFLFNFWLFKLRCYVWLQKNSVKDFLFYFQSVIFKQVWNCRFFELIWLAKVYVMISDWLKMAAISNIFEDHTLKLE